MKVFVSSQNVPIGYTTPKFPSLYWPVGRDNSHYQVSFLYYRIDIWKFTVFWGLILSGGLYCSAGVVASAASLFNKSRQRSKVSVWMLLEALLVVSLYAFVGLFKGFVSGAIIGLIVGAIYRAGELSMSTWIPFCWSVAIILFDVCSSYSTSAIIL
ncbi:hypothetical protein DIURU_004019 [Diutina rugosa]|uniref:Uncharacterized protein n=1 Tax=Diutina rugosa TaxID=5481 RepID=A0A642UJ52_DIURU|nr:uncharacterized protein DIURU_004019 [Diutina rugosa]KAA8899978.1 hypothetical protein DIURU_004019 [Diutina rugosa]